MKKRALLVVLIFFLATIACDEFSAILLEGGKDDFEPVKTYPLSLLGTATVTEYWKAGSCTMPATATFFAGDDQFCQLTVSFAYTNLEGGKCVPNGETKAWIVQGHFEKSDQKCRFSSCNDRPDAYEASGILQFYPTRSAWMTASCSLIKNSEKQVSIEVPAMHK